MGEDVNIKSNQIVDLEDFINNLTVITGTVNNIPNTTVSFGSYIVYKNILIISANIKANVSIPQYSTIAKLSEGGKCLTNNAYISSTSNKNTYIIKNNGNIQIYQAGGMASGETLYYMGLFQMNS